MEAEQQHPVVVELPRQRTALSKVAACTVEAAHRRDHQHLAGSPPCQPHAVEVVHLGGNAITICHDCGTDSGFMPTRDAERLAFGHQQQTRIASVALPLAATIEPA